MKLKRLFSFLLVIALCIGLTACGNAAQPATEAPSKPPVSDSSAPILYRVTDADGNIAWLFGSIHVGRADYYPLPAYVQNAFDRADALAVELDLIAFEQDLSQQIAALTPLIYSDGTTVKDHIPQELYERTVAILRAYDTYAEILDYYYPSMLSSMIDMLMIEQLGGDPNLGVDRHLLNAAYDAHKPIIEIESAAFQYQMMADFDDDIQIALLQSSVDAYDDPEGTAAELEQMLDLWASGNESDFAAFLNETDESLTAEEQELLDRYNKAMETDRNITMADYAEEALASGKEVFICVGAAHILGEGAMADLLAQRGYTVERVLLE